MKKSHRFPPQADGSYMKFLTDTRSIVIQAQRLDVIKNRALADSAKLSPQTVTNFVSGKTIAPQLPTVYRMLRAVGVALLPETGRPHTPTVIEEVQQPTEKKTKAKSKLVEPELPSQVLKKIAKKPAKWKPNAGPVVKSRANGRGRFPESYKR